MTKTNVLNFRKNVQIDFYKREQSDTKIAPPEVNEQKGALYRKKKTKSN